MKRHSRILWTLAAVAMTVAVLWWMLDAKVIAELGAAVRHANVGRLVIALSMVPLIQLVRAMRFDLMLTGRLRRPSYELYRIGALLVFFNYALPFRTGELSFPLLAKQRLGIGVASSTGVLVFTRVLDLVAVVGLAAATGAVVLSAGVGSLSRGALGLVAGGSLLLMLALPLAGRFTHLGALRALRRFPKASGFIDKLFAGLHNLRTVRQQVGSLILTLLVWALQFVLSYNAASAVSDLSLAQIMFAHSAASLAFALPINGVAGVGPTQAAWALALEQTGETFELGVTTALIWHSVPVFGALLLAAVVASPPRRIDQGSAEVSTESGEG